MTVRTGAGRAARDAAATAPASRCHETVCVPCILAHTGGDRDTGVRVVLRARPLNALERSKSADSLCVAIDGDSVMCKVARQEHAGSLRFSFDKVFGPDSAQHDVYDFIGPQAIAGTGGDA